MRYAITQYNVVWYQMIQDSIVYYNTIPYNAIQHSRISYTHRRTHRYTHRISSPPLYIALHVRQHSYGRIVTAHLNNMLTSRRTSTDRCTHRRIHTLPPTTSYYCYARVDRHVWHRPREHNFPGEVMWGDTLRARAPVFMHHVGQFRCEWCDDGYTCIALYKQ